MKKRTSALACIGIALVAISASTQTFGQGKRKPVSVPATPLQSLAPSQAVPSPPTGALRLRHIGTANDGPARIWIEETGLKRRGQIAEFWVLQALPADQTANRQAVAGNWTFMRLDCAGGTASPRRAVIITSAARALLDSGTLPDAPSRPSAGSTPAKLIQFICSPPPASVSAPLLSDAQNATQAIAWTRNPILGRPAQQQSEAGDDIGLPRGPLALKDLMLDRDKTEGFFTFYTTPGNLMASRSENIWVLMVSSTDRSFTMNGRTIAAAARWTNWVTNCDRNELTIREAGLVGADGRITRIPAQSLPRARERTLFDRGGEKATMPDEPEAQLLYDSLCPSVEGAILGNIKSGLQPLAHASAQATIAASRRARNLTIAERTTAISCLALTYSTQSLADGVANEPWANLGIKTKLSIFARLLREAIGAEHVTRAALTPPRERFAAMINAAKNSKNMTAINRELDQCIVTLPVGLERGQFSD